MRILLKVIGLFLMIFIGFAAIGYYFYTHLSEPTNAFIFLALSNLGLVLGIYFSKKTIPKKSLPYKSTENKIID